MTEVGIEEVTAVKDVQSTEMKGGFVMCERTGQVGEERQLVRVKGPPQKKKSGNTSGIGGDYVSGQQGREELGGTPERSQ